MRWPPWSTAAPAPTTGDSCNNPTHNQRRRPLYASPEFGLSCLGVGAAVLLAAHVYRNFVRRVPTASHIPPRLLRRRSLLGQVTSVGDGDNFRIYHTPGGRLLGWGWAPGRRVPTARRELKDQTVSFPFLSLPRPPSFPVRSRELIRRE